MLIQVSCQLSGLKNSRIISLDFGAISGQFWLENLAISLRKSCKTTYQISRRICASKLTAVNQTSTCQTRQNYVMSRCALKLLSINGHLSSEVDSCEKNRERDFIEISPWKTWRSTPLEEANFCCHRGLYQRWDDSGTFDSDSADCS